MFSNEKKSGNDPVGRFLAENGDELKSLADTEDGRAVRKLLAPQGEALKKAAASGDASALSAALKDVIATEEGRKLVERLGAMLGK